MTPVLFYGVPAGCSFGSIVALEWLEEPYQLCRMDLHQISGDQAFKRINPLAKTPVLITAAGTPLNESLAILNHIGARGTHKQLAFPQGNPQFDQLNRVLAFLNGTLFTAFGLLWDAEKYSAEAPEKEVLTNHGRREVERAYRALEAMLGDREWLLGEHRTLADAYFYGIARWNEYHNAIDRRDYPNVQRLYEKLAADPAVGFAHAIEQQQAAVSAGGFRGELDLGAALQQLVEPLAESSHQ